MSDERSRSPKGGKRARQGLDRRRFLMAGGALGVTLPARAGLPVWTREPGAPFSNYGAPSPNEADVVRWIAANPAAAGNGVSWSPLHELEGTLTPNGLFFERHHNGVPAIDPEAHRLVVHGLVERPLEFTIDDLLRYPMTTRQAFIECGGNSNAAWQSRPVQAPVGYFHGLVSASEWTGVRVRDLLTEAGLRKTATWAVAEGADAIEHHMSVPVAKLMDDALLVLFQNGERLRPENGYPVRLLLPGFEGVLNVKWLKRLELTNRPAMSRNETARYTELLPDGTARAFTFGIGVKSLITRPSCSTALPGPGFVQISGLAWSGAGRIERVEVSTDGGESWSEAALDGPALPQMFTRFRFPWRFDGRPAVLKSRATDETGAVQPERDALIETRGRHGYFHYNAIVTYEVDADGYVSHVYA